MKRKRLKDMGVSDLYEACIKLEYDNIGDDVSYKILREDDSLFVFFQGSDGKNDWLNNFRFFAKASHKTPYKDMEIPYKVHGGFLRCWKQVEDIIIGVISNVSIRSITIVGYSHGAALAQLCHECCWFHREDLREGKIITYAIEAPRVYANFKKKYREELLQRWSGCYIFRNSNDLVTHLPPK